MTKVEVLPIEQGATQDPSNVNKHSARGGTLLENSLRKRGAFRSIASAGKGVEIPVTYAGNYTLEKAVEAGFKEIVNVHVRGDQLVNVVRDDIEPGSAQAIALGLEDNESASKSYNPDIDILAALAAGDSAILSELRKEDKVFGGMLEGMGLKDETQDAEPQIDRAAELLEKWQVKTGDLWTIGDHRLLCGDSTKREDVERVMGGESARLCFTSPPYADAREYGGSDLTIETLSRFFSCSAPFVELFAVNLGILRENNEVVCYWDKYIGAAKAEGLKFLSWNIWNREDPYSMAQQTAMFPIEHEFIFIFGKERRDLNKTKPNKHAGESTGLTNRQKDGSLSDAQTKSIGAFRRMGTVFTGRPNAGKDIGHPAMFPVVFPEAYIEACTNNGDVVSDPFSGSGTTMVACQNLGRKCRAIEIIPAYCAVTLERMATAFPELEIARVDTPIGTPNG